MLWEGCLAGRSRRSRLADDSERAAVDIRTKQDVSYVYAPMQATFLVFTIVMCAELSVYLVFTTLWKAEGNVGM